MGVRRWGQSHQGVMALKEHRIRTLTQERGRGKFISGSRTTNPPPSVHFGSSPSPYSPFPMSWVLNFLTNQPTVTPFWDGMKILFAPSDPPSLLTKLTSSQFTLGMDGTQTGTHLG